MSEHFLNAAKIGAAFEQVRGERVAEQMRVDAGRLEALGSRRRTRTARPSSRAPPQASRRGPADAAVEMRSTRARVAANGVRPAGGQGHAVVPCRPCRRRGRAGRRGRPKRARAPAPPRSEAGAIEELDERAVAHRRGVTPRAASTSRWPPTRRACAAAAAGGARLSPAAGLSLRSPRSCWCSENAAGPPYRRGSSSARSPSARSEACQCSSGGRSRRRRRGRARSPGRSGRAGTRRLSAASAGRPEEQEALGLRIGMAVVIDLP